MNIYLYKKGCFLVLSITYDKGDDYMANNLIPQNNHTITNISEKLSKYLDIRDTIFENEFVEASGDSFKIIKLFKTGHDLISQRKLNAFLDGFCYDDTPTEEQLSKLDKYIDNENKAEFVATMFSRVLMSNSKLACMVMGVIINDLTNENEDITHSQLICANSLTGFFDADIINYYHIINFSYERSLRQGHMHMQYNTKVGFYDYAFRKFLNENYYDINSMNMTLHKATSYQLFLTEIEVDIDVDVDVDEDFDAYTDTDVSPSTYFVITEAGKLLYEYINKISSCFN